jgi:hypothetical protein
MRIPFFVQQVRDHMWHLSGKDLRPAFRLNDRAVDVAKRDDSTEETDRSLELGKLFKAARNATEKAPDFGQPQVYAL